MVLRLVTASTDLVGVHPYLTYPSLSDLVTGALSGLPG